MQKCPNCGNILSQEMIDANLCWECGYILDESQTDGISDVINMQRIEIKKKEYANSVGNLIEYDVETLMTSSDGFTNTEEMNEILKKRVANGWRLHSIYSNPLGVNAVRILGIGTNATISESVMIFERIVMKE